MKPVDPRPLILHVLFRFDVGGLENGVVNLLNRLPEEQWRHAVLAVDDIAPSFCRRVSRPGVEYIALHKPPGHLFRLYPRLHALLRKLGPSIVHSRNLAALEATLPAWLAGVPVRIHGEHGWDVSDLGGKGLRPRLTRRLYRPFVTRYVALSRHIADYLQTSVGIAPEAIRHICNGVDTTRFQPVLSRTPIPGSPFNDTNLWLVGTVGRLAAVKDQVTLARAFVRARELDADAANRMRLVVAGDGPLRGAVAQVLREGGAESFSWLAGEREDVPDVLRGLDAFVLPSLAEGISNTILEAMATALPIVATAVGGNAELIDDDQTGRLVPAADPLRLAEALLDDFRDRAGARRRGRAAREAAERRFSVDRMVSEYGALYESELARAGRAPLGREHLQTPS